MRLLKKLVTLTGVILVLVTGCVLYLFNSDPVVLNLVWLEVPPTSLAVVIIATFFVGIVIGSVFAFGGTFISVKQKPIK